MNAKQFTLILVTICAFGVFYIYSQMPGKTPEQIQAETQQKIDLQKMQMEREQQENQMYIDRKKAEADAQAKKPVEVQVAETQTSVGEGIQNAALVGGGIYVLSKLFSD